MKDIVIVGNSSFAKLMHQYIEDVGDRQVVAFSVNSQFIQYDRQKMFGKPIVPLEHLEKLYPADRYDVIIGVGYNGMNTVRQKLYFICKEKGYHVTSFVHPTANISKSVQIGEGNIILEQCSLSPLVRIGDLNILWNNVQLAHEDVVGSFNTISVGVSVAGCATIGNNCFLGVNSTVFDHVRIADFTLIGAAAFAKRNTHPYDVIVPAHSITLPKQFSTNYI